MRRLLLSCGVAAALVYIGADIVAGMLYPGYSFMDQAVSELFAIGAPTSGLVVALFTLSSVLILGFAAGVWASAGGDRALGLAALMFAAMAVNGLALWLLFPMHMRGDVRTFTDTMHIVFSVNPFVLVGIGAILATSKGPFRLYTIATALILVVPAIWAFKFVPAVDANLPTPGMGVAERTAQYGFNVWQAALAVLLIRRSRTT